MENMLKDQIAIVTGGTAGIGKEVCLKFASQGAFVIIIGTNEERGNEVKESICSIAGKEQAEFCKVDLSQKKDVDLAIKGLLEKHKKIDILVNNAGISRDQLFLKMSEADWDLILNVNLKSCYNISQALMRSMLKARQGSIINMSSVIGLVGNIGQVHYAASKAAIIGFTKALAKELASRDIRVNCIAPGFIQTPMTDVLPEEKKQILLKEIPLNKFGTPEDVANAALFLASSMSKYITGQTIVVDGGMTMH